MAEQPRSLTGTVVAITGGARGIGRATAQAMHAQGARVAIGDLDGELAAEVAAGLGDGALGLALDVTDGESFEAFLAEAEGRLGPVDVLVNSAGVMPLSTFAEEDTAARRRVIDVNLEGAMIGSQLAISRFLERDAGEIVNIVGIAGRIGLAGGVTYSATQHALAGMSSALRAELRRTGIGVRVILTTIVDTEMTSGLRRQRVLGAVAPEAVADAVVQAVRFEVDEVHVPRWTGRLVSLMPLAPVRLRGLLRRALGVDRILTRFEERARAPYEERVAPPSFRDPAVSIASAAASVASAVEAHDQKS